MGRKMILVLTLAFLLLFAIAPLMSHSVGAEKSEVETTDIHAASLTVVFSEAFESAFPGTAWSVGDWNSGGGYDYWNRTSYRADSGSYSGWCANVGVQSIKTTIFSENFEGGGFPGWVWTVGDSNSLDGFDYWDDVDVRAHTGFSSGWCNGYPDPDASSYDDNMDAYMWRAVNLNGYSSSVYLSYYYYLRCQGGYHDTLNVEYFDGAWHILDIRTGDLGNAWYSNTVSIPNTATLVGFRFISDDSVSTLVGAYLDDIELYGYRDNSAAHRYDVKMDAYMYRAVNLSALSSVTLSYRYWLNSESGHDYLRVMYYSGGSMYYVDSHSGNSGGWVGSNVSIPKSATLVGFYFFSDTANAINEGAYIDNVVLSGYETVSIDIWTNKHAYTIGETMIVYLRVSNLGPATPVRAIIKLQLPNGNWYGPLLDMTTTLPAGFDSGTYLWNSFKIPTAPLGTYKWLAELRRSATNALIDSDIYIWTLT